MLIEGQDLFLPAGTPFRSFNANNDAFDAHGRLKEDAEVRIEAVSWELIKVRGKVPGTGHILRQDALRADGVIQTEQRFIDRRPAAGDKVLIMDDDTHGVVRDVKQGQVWLYKAHDKDVHKVTADHVIVTPSSPFGYVKAGFPSFESLVGMSKQGYLRRPKTGMITTEAGFQLILDRFKQIALQDEPLIALDTETTGLTNRAYIDGPNFVIGLCIGWDANSGLYLPYEDRFRDWHIRLLSYAQEHLISLFHNATFDIIAIQQAYGLDMRYNFHDTQVISKLVDENRMNHKLKPLAEDILGREDVIHYDSVSNPDNTLVGVDPLIVTEYAGADAANTYGLYETLMPQLQADPDLLNYYLDTEIPSIARIAVPIANNGLNVDKDRLLHLHDRITVDGEDHMDRIHISVQPFLDQKARKHAREVKHLIQLADDRMESLYGDTADPTELSAARALMKQVTNLAAATSLSKARAFKSIQSYLSLCEKAAAKESDAPEFNPGSKKQLQELIHDFWGLPVVKLTKKGEEVKDEKKGPWTKADERQYSSVGTKSIPALQLALKAQKTPNPDAEAFFDAFVAYSKTSKLVSSFTRPTLANLDESGTTVIHPTFNSLGTKSSRSSCQNPNLQQLPSDDKLYDLRDCFIPDTPDHVFIDADFNAQEIRVMAAFSRDPDLLRIIEEGRDLHCHTVRTVWPETQGLDDDEIKDHHKPKRQKAKVTFFLQSYGGGKYKLAESLLIPVDEAGHIINTLKFKAFPQLTAWKTQAALDYEQTGLITLPCGYKRRLKGWEKAKDPARAKAGAIRSGVNTIIQGTSAEMMKAAWFRVEDALQAAGIPYQIKILVHDQMVFQVHKDDAVAAAHLTNTHMHSTLFDVPVPAEVEIKSSLSKSKDANHKELEAEFHGEVLTYDDVSEMLGFDSEVYIE